MKNGTKDLQKSQKTINKSRVVRPCLSIIPLHINTLHSSLTLGFKKNKNQVNVVGRELT